MSRTKAVEKKKDTMRNEHCILNNTLFPDSYNLRHKGEGGYDKLLKTYSVYFIFFQSTAALLRRKPLSNGSSRDTYRAQESDKIQPDAFPQLVYLTNVCHLWIPASWWEWCTCTNIDLLVSHRHLVQAVLEG